MFFCITSIVNLYIAGMKTFQVLIFLFISLTIFSQKRTGLFDSDYSEDNDAYFGYYTDSNKTIISTYHYSENIKASFVQSVDDCHFSVSPEDKSKEGLVFTVDVGDTGVIIIEGDDNKNFRDYINEDRKFYIFFSVWSDYENNTYLFDIEGLKIY